MLETLDAATVRRWCGGGLEALRAHQREIDDLNVYPVPDGDTGTNLVLTLTAAYEALDEETPEPGRPVDRLMRRMARGALLGARGNSGVIVSQILRGMADTFATVVTVRGPELARALRMATDAAYAAVARPVEGTVLSVVAAAAEGAGRIKSDNLLAVARAAARAAAEALDRTPQQLPVLARAGVVDAGGRGLCLLLDALVDAVAGETAEDGGNHGGRAGAAAEEAGGNGVRITAERTPNEHDRNSGSAPQVESRKSWTGTRTSEAGGEHADRAGGPGADRDDCSGYGYEVQYLLDAPPEAVTKLRETLDALGDSLVVVGTGDGTWNVHVHVADVGPAIEAGIEAGRPYKISVTRLEERRPGHDLRAAVVVAAGDGLTALFEGEGAMVVDRNPSTAELLAAIAATGAGSVVVLPNDANTHAVATSAAREAAAGGVQVSVVPTRSPVQALAALAVRDPQRPFPDDVIAMAEAAGACRYGEVCTAQRDALTVAGPCRAGDLLGLVDGEVHVIGNDLTEVSRLLLDRMLGGGGELVTCVLGADAPPDLEDRIREHTHRTWPFIELQCYAGGQPRYHLLAGVE
ncbi:putative phosphatase [Actinoplanes missouriensis 431]|uniref:Putative phosphatase n=1 Tax=Actinoplanes missouriensis (strain ATCC 14538 / DSM 43046 / CBS 188.64 / JCM 3121 / NBRC 102363 / NCIMB 12654 / NRRL B-3342 / UNCC 431) TaxID=512565 RepID=I0HH10_ACTM4|nr:DAK2 domain-containing protein [Actinoplanes missouriensis]BAL92297.1 putative phosphatase [Actinoplanes missouriensis 431]